MRLLFVLLTGLMIVSCNQGTEFVAETGANVGTEEVKPKFVSSSVCLLEKQIYEFYLEEEYKFCSYNAQKRTTYCKALNSSLFYSLDDFCDCKRYFGQYDTDYHYSCK